jgi:hypothetical protein
VTTSEGWKRVAAALAARGAPPLLAGRPWHSAVLGSDLAAVAAEEALPATLRIAAALVADRPGEALSVEAADPPARQWRAVALRRAGEFAAARRLFRELGERPFYPSLYRRALIVLGATGPGFRWAYTTRCLLAARGNWDPLWFVDACAAVHEGVLSLETAALLAEIERAELQLMAEEGFAG